MSAARRTIPPSGSGRHLNCPQDEILSRILFDRAAGGLSGAQAVQLAQGIATLSGGGPGVFDQLRRALGVDSLDITADAEAPAVGVSRYVADNVRIGVRAGARPEDTGVSVDIDLTRRLRLQSQVGADGRSSVRNRVRNRVLIRNRMSGGSSP